MQIVSLAVVALAGSYLLLLGVACLVAGGRVATFFNGFASSAATHYLEQAIRLVVGIALVVTSPAMLASQVFRVFGWVIIATSACLLLVPWRWHNRFAAQVIPFALRILPLVGIVSIVLGVAILWSLAAKP